jgi:hypothetical protein
MTADSETATIRLENRALQALLVVSVAVLSWLLVAMFDRLENDIEAISLSVHELENENAVRDSKLAQLVLQIERRITTLESKNE